MDLCNQIPLVVCIWDSTGRSTAGLKLLHGGWIMDTANANEFCWASDGQSTLQAIYSIPLHTMILRVKGIRV
jgi:hypothetical protein